MKPSVLLALALLGVGCAGPRYTLRSDPPAARSGPRALGLVRVKPPWYATRGAITSRFVDAVPEYEGVPSLETKYFTIADDGRYGGIYLWSSRPAAEAYYSEAWRAGIRQRRGVEPDLLVLDAPVVIEGQTAIEGEPVGQRTVRYRATAALALWPAASGAMTPAPDASAVAAQELARRLDGDAARRPGLLRAIVVTEGSERVGFVGLWATRALAEQALSPTGLAALGASGADVTLLDAPVLLDAGLRAR